MTSAWKTLKSLLGLSTLKKDEVNKSSYSMVSTGDLTQENVRLWLGLPPEVRRDPALEPFRRFYEEQNGSTLEANNDEKLKQNIKLHSTKSAPVLENLNLITKYTENGDENEIQCKKEKEWSKDDVCVQDPNGKTTKAFHETRPTKKATTGHYIKMTLLLACWIFFTLIFLMYGEKKDFVVNTSLSPGEIKSYELSLSETDTSVLVTLSGPFLTEQAETALNRSELAKLQKTTVWMENGNKSVVTKPSEFYLHEKVDFSAAEPRSAIFKIAPVSNRTWFIKINTTESRTIPFMFSYYLNPLDVSTGVVYSIILLFGLYVLIIFENRKHQRNELH